MAFHYSELRDDIIKSLTFFSQQTESVFTAMGHTYPGLITDMTRSLNATNALLGANNRRISGGSQSNAAMVGIIDEIEQYLTKVSSIFTEENIRDLDMHKNMGIELEAVSGLKNHIDHIREDSGAMELISLNAMTVALKAGSQGRAFSFITEELKRLSTRTIDLTEIVTRRGADLISRFEVFQKNLRTLGEAEHNIFGTFAEKIGVSFKDFSEGLSQIFESLSAIQTDAEKIIAPLTVIISEIQKHDLIRQSVDHVIISLKEIKMADETDDIEGMLDELSFLELLPELCTNVIEDVAVMLQKSKEIFQTNLRIAHEAMQDIEKQRLHFVQVAIDKTIAGSLENRFSHIFSLFEAMYTDITDLYRKKETTVRNSKEIQSFVRDLNESFRDFDSLIMRFRTIDVASRIEIAKQEVLGQMRGTVDEMTALTLRIEQDVEGSASLTSRFLEGTKKLLEMYRVSVVKQSGTVRDFIEELKRKSDRLRESKNLLTSSILNQRIFADTFLQSFSKTKEDLDSFEELLRLLKDLQGQLSATKQKISAEKAQFMRENNLVDWKIGNAKLKSMIERFTIFTHKKLAGDIGGFSVEQGIQSGEITLF